MNNTSKLIQEVYDFDEDGMYRETIPKDIVIDMIVNHNEKLINSVEHSIRLTHNLLKHSHNPVKGGALQAIERIADELTITLKKWGDKQMKKLRNILYRISRSSGRTASRLTDIQNIRKGRLGRVVKKRARRKGFRAFNKFLRKVGL